MSLQIIILAAGQGKRMHADLPKVLQQLAGRPLLAHVIDTAVSLNPAQIHVICGYRAEQVKQAVTHPLIHWVHQAEQAGTGHAVAQALPFCQQATKILVLFGDVPLVSTATLNQVLNSPAALTLLTASTVNPTGLGRIIRDKTNQLVRIVEEKDASPAEKNITEIFSGILATTAPILQTLLPKITNKNKQNEYYLTDLIPLALQQGQSVDAILLENPQEILGVNTQQQLVQLERLYQQKLAERYLNQGVYIADPARFDCRGQLVVGKGVTIDINGIFKGEVTLADNVSIGPNCYLENVQIGAGTTVKANSVITDANIGAHCEIGPFARIRPGTQLADHVKIGNFVEIKQSIIHQGSKVNHLSYIGDAILGEQVNIGAGTITCNYDGVNKHQTIIEPHVFIGSGTHLVAPVTVGHSATTGAGTTVRKDIPARALAISQAPQKHYTNWQRPVKKSEKD